MIPSVLSMTRFDPLLANILLGVHALTVVFRYSSLPAPPTTEVAKQIIEE